MPTPVIVIRQLVEALTPLGATTKHYYPTLGDYDAVLIYEAPSPIAATALAKTLGAAESMTRVKTTPLLNVKEAMEAMELSGKTQNAYRPASS